MEALLVIRNTLLVIMFIYLIYQTCIGICGLLNIKEKKPDKIRKNKFMAVIPAHNEEKVIANLIKSLKLQKYDNKFYDIYVIADNCTDNTAQIAKENGAIVYERFDSQNKTKGGALNWFLKKKIEENVDYDAICIFDADNIVDENYLKEMNLKLCNGDEVIQGYRDIKNPCDNWITAGYSLYYWTMHKLYHLPRYYLGLSTLLNGTGITIKFDVIKQDGGWNTETLTEDIEYSLQTIIKGKKVSWATEAVVYDEEPLKFKQSWSQRSRWTVGHIQCVKKYILELIEAFSKKKTLTILDAIIYIMGSIPLFIANLGLIIINFVLYFAQKIPLEDLIWGVGGYLSGMMILPIFGALLVLVLEKKPVKPMLKGLVCYPLFLGSWLIINLKCIFKPNEKWEKIEHLRSIKIEDIKV